MKKLVYLKLNNMAQDLYWPEELVSSFWIGSDVVLVILPCKGEIVFEYPFEGHLQIKDADDAYLVATNSKKIPSNVVCYFE